MGNSPSVFITGASSGIGAALVRHYAARGATLGLVARRADALNELAHALPCTHQIFVADVMDADAMLAAGDQFVAKVGPPDIVIANAGISCCACCQTLYMTSSLPTRGASRESRPSEFTDAS